MRHGLLTIMVLASLWAVVPASAIAAEDSKSFKDLDDKHWAKSAIEQAVSLRYVEGYPDGTFRPSNSVTRAEVAAMLSRVTKLTPDVTSDAFPDLADHWSRDNVRKLVALGFIDTKDYAKAFAPDKAITRYELMKWMATGLSASESSFRQALVDTQDTLLPTPESFNGGVTKEQVPYIALVRGTGVVNGFPDGSFKPAEKATRAEVLTMLMRYAKVEGTKADSYRDLSEMRAIGVEKTNIEVISGYRFLQDYKFTNIVGKTLTFPDMDVVIHKMIVVDLTTEEQVGLYAPIFVGNDRKPYQKGFYYLFFESTITMKTDGFNYLKLSGQITRDNNIYHFSRVDDDVTKRLELIVIPLDDPDKFMTKGTPRNIWSMGAIPPRDGGYIIARDGKKFHLFEG